jgi:hypothetical protein
MIHAHVIQNEIGNDQIIFSLHFLLTGRAHFGLFDETWKELQVQGFAFNWLPEIFQGIWTFQEGGIVRLTIWKSESDVKTSEQVHKQTVQYWTYN